jgi:predicted protein tyrosine phosphatase
VVFSGAKTRGVRISWKRRCGFSTVLTAHDSTPLFSVSAKRILFLCSRNKLRSPTAEAIFADNQAIEVDSAGLNNDAEVPLSEEQVLWADLIIVMEKVHRNRLNLKFKSSLAGKRIAVLNIPDEYDYMDPALVALLKVRCAPYLP